MTKEKIIEVLFGLEIVEVIFFKPSKNMSSNHCNHCVPDATHIPRMILALSWSQSDNNYNNNNNNNNNINNNDNNNKYNNNNNNNNIAIFIRLP